MPDELSEAQLEALVDDVDGVRHIALAGYVAGEAVALARLIHSPDDPHTAELAVSVLDAFHGQGVASLLIAQLLSKAPDVCRIEAWVDLENRPAVALMAKFGEVTLKGGSAAYEATIDVSGRTLASQ